MRIKIFTYIYYFCKEETQREKHFCGIIESLLAQSEGLSKELESASGCSRKIFLWKIWHILQWIHTALASKWISFDGVANKATAFCCCANTFLPFFLWPPANYTCYFCLGNLLSWKRKYKTTFQRKPLKLLGWQHLNH